MSDDFTKPNPIGYVPPGEEIGRVARERSIGFIAGEDRIGAKRVGERIGENVAEVGRKTEHAQNSSKYDRWAGDLAKRGALRDLAGDPAEAAKRELEEQLGRIHARMARLQMHVAEHGRPTGTTREVKRLEGQRAALQNEIQRITQSGAVKLAKQLQHVNKIFPTRLETQQRVKDVLPPSLRAVDAQPAADGDVLTMTNGVYIGTSPSASSSENKFVGLVYYPGGTEPYDMGLPDPGALCFAYDSLASDVASMFTYTTDTVASSTESRPLIKLEHMRMRWPFIAYRFGG